MPANLTPILQLPPGSTKYHLVGLTPSATYTAVVAHLEPAPSVGYTQPAQVTFTTGAGVSTCAAPDDPIPFVIAYPNATHMSCGVAAYNKEPVPGTALVFYEATETAVGSGTFGSFTECGRQLVNPFAWGVYLENFPTDGLRRLFQVTASRPGVTDSSATANVMVSPGVTLQPQDYPVAIPTALTVAGGGFSVVEIVAPDRMTPALIALYTPPTDHQFDHMEYLVQQLSAGVWSQGQTVIGGSQGNDVILTLPTGTASSGSFYQITPITVTKGSAGAPFLPGNPPILATRLVGSIVSIQIPPLPANPTITGSAGGGSANFTIQFSQGTAYVKMYAFDFGTTNPGTIDSVEALANLVAPDLYPNAAGGNVTRSVSLTATHYGGYTFVPYSSAGLRGVATTIKLLGTASGTPNAPTLSLPAFPGAAGGNWAYPNWVGIKVTFVSAPTAGDTLSLFRASTQVASYTVTASDVTNGYAIVIDPTAVYPNSYVYTAIQTSQSGGSSAASGTLNVTMLAGFTLVAPSTFTFTAPPFGGGGGKVVGCSAAAFSWPPTALCDMQYRLGTVGPYTDLGSVQVGSSSASVGYRIYNPTAYVGTVDVQAQISCPGYTSSSFGTGATTFP